MSSFFFTQRGQDHANGDLVEAQEEMQADSQSQGVLTEGDDDDFMDALDDHQQVLLDDVPTPTSKGRPKSPKSVKSAGLAPDSDDEFFDAQED